MITWSVKGKWQGSFEALVIKKQEDKAFEKRLRFIFDSSITSAASCPVCFEGYEINQPVVLLSCNHLIHQVCLSLWQKDELTEKPCVVCRKSPDVGIYFSQEAESYLLKLDILKEIFQDTDLMLEAISIFRKDLTVEDTALFNEVLQAFFSIFRVYYSLEVLPYSNERIKKEALLLFSGLEDSFFKLLPSVRNQLLNIFIRFCHQSLCNDSILFDNLIELNRDRYLHGPYNSQKFFIG